MARRGLDEAGRNHVAQLVDAGRSGESVRDAIRHRVRADKWDYDKNVSFLRWLRAQGYDESAEFLARYMED